MIVESSVKDIISFTTHLRQIEKKRKIKIDLYQEKFPLIHAQTQQKSLIIIILVSITCIIAKIFKRKFEVD